MGQPSLLDQLENDVRHRLQEVRGVTGAFKLVLAIEERAEKRLPHARAETATAMLDATRDLLVSITALRIHTWVLGV